MKVENSPPEKNETSQEKAAYLDLTSVLEAWRYDDAKSVRRIRARNGRELIQVRLPLGIEQYEINGRPDGQRPMEQESWLHHYLRESTSAGRRRRRGQLLGDEDFQRLHQEGLLYYYRYLLFFQIHEYRLCARDTKRNLRLLDFVGQHAKPELAEQLEQYRPYILRMNIMARALLRLQDSGEIRYALRLLRNGRRKIEELEPIEGNQVFEWETTRALVSLDDLISQLEAQIPVPRSVQLRRQLKAAVDEENYEKAAEIRDELASMDGKPGKKSPRCERG